MQEMCNLVEQCWHPDPKERLTFIRISEELRRISRISKSEKRRKGSPGSPGHRGSADEKNDGGEDGLDAPSCKCVVM